MAKIFDRDMAGEEGPYSERLTLDALRKLGDDWTVFQSIKWQSLRNGRQGDGEADFALLHPDMGLLVLEVKGGTIELNNGKWSTTDQYGERHQIKNPFEQARASKYGLLEYLSQSGASLKSIPVNYAVVFPSCSVDGDIGPAGSRPIVIDMVDLRDIERSVRRVVEHWEVRQKVPARLVEEIGRLLAPTMSLKPLLGHLVACVRNDQIELTRQQIDLFSRLTRVRTLLTRGGAGTGKTILAVERARKLGRDGFSTLMVCFNQLLAEKLQDTLAGEKNVQVGTFHSIALRFMRQANLSVPNQMTEVWWEEEAALRLLDAAQVVGRQYDALVVDEFQDFRAEWIEALRELSGRVPDAPLYLFGDYHQELYGRGFELPNDYAEYVLDVNCRSTAPINKRFEAIFDKPLANAGASGPEPVFSVVESSVEAEALVESFVTRLMAEQGLRPEQIVVLSDKNDFISSMRERSVESWSFCPYGKTGIVVESVRRFKGLEADAIILVLLGPPSQDSKTIGYVGMSRARAYLAVLASAAHRAELRWD
jgi:hypothetical protein